VVLRAVLFIAISALATAFHLFWRLRLSAFLGLVNFELPTPWSLQKLIFSPHFVTFFTFYSIFPLFVSFFVRFYPHLLFLFLNSPTPFYKGYFFFRIIYFFFRHQHVDVAFCVSGWCGGVFKNTCFWAEISNISLVARSFVLILFCVSTKMLQSINGFVWV